MFVNLLLVLVIALVAVQAFQLQTAKFARVTSLNVWKAKESNEHFLKTGWFTLRMFDFYKLVMLVNWTDKKDK
jgi:hypothetical protein